MCDASGDVADALDDVVGLGLQAVDAAVHVASNPLGLALDRAPAAPHRGGAATLEPVQPLGGATSVRIDPKRVGHAVPRFEGSSDRNQDCALGLPAQRLQAPPLGLDRAPLAAPL